jgi:hypothetical protein
MVNSLEDRRAVDVDDNKLLLKNEVFQIVGCAIEVLNALGHGLIEKPYENALVVEFGLRNIASGSNRPPTLSTKARRLGCSFPTWFCLTRSLSTQRSLTALPITNVG